MHGGMRSVCWDWSGEAPDSEAFSQRGARREPQPRVPSLVKYTRLAIRLWTSPANKCEITPLELLGVQGKNLHVGKKRTLRGFEPATSGAESERVSRCANEDYITTVDKKSTRALRLPVGYSFCQRGRCRFSVSRKTLVDFWNTGWCI